MHKGAVVVLRIWVEGEDEPAQDFGRRAVECAQEIFTSGQSRHHPHWKAIVRKSFVDDDPPDYEEMQSGVAR